MSIYFVRHGQTDWNLNHKIMGRTDIELNDTGREQARKMRGTLKNKQFDAILTSPLIRARETAEIIAEAYTDTPLIVADVLAERNFGDFEGKSSHGDYFYGLWQYSAEARGGQKHPETSKHGFSPGWIKLRKSMRAKIFSSSLMAESD